MEFYPGLDIEINHQTLDFIYGADTFGPEMEKRTLEEIRESLRDSDVDGPMVPYSIAMDVGKKKDINDLNKRQLLYGAVIYSKGRFGKEPVRSQGHIHTISESCNSATPEVYEIWEGEAIIYMQETAKDNPGKCYAVFAKAGEVVIVPPGWAHYTVNANPDTNMVFGAWCVRDFGFDYEDVRAHKGLAYFPILKQNNAITWEANKRYQREPIIVKNAREYTEFGLKKGVPIYQQYEDNHELFTFVTKPGTAKEIWQHFEP